jgi:galactokinase
MRDSGPIHFVFGKVDSVPAADSVPALHCRSITRCCWTIDFGLEVMIGDTRSKREAAGSEYRSRRAQREDSAQRMGILALYDVTFEALMQHRAAPLP